MAAIVIPLPPANRFNDPASLAALAELVQIGLAVARTAQRLAAAEDAAIDALADTAAAAARGLATPAASLEHARRAGQDADVSEAARDAATARVAIITACVEKAARIVRRTVALQARLATARPFAGFPAPATNPPGKVDDGSRSITGHGTEPAEPADRPENGDELGTFTDDEALQAIHRDLSAIAPILVHLAGQDRGAGFGPPLPAPAARPDMPRADGAGITPATAERPIARPDPPPAPDT